MTNEKTDRRILRTERRLQDALVMLLKTKSIQQISVRELANTANITRATFYTHYRNPMDMLRHLQDKMVSQIIEIINTFLNVDTSEFFIQLFRYFANDVRYPNLLFIPTGEDSTFQRIGFMIIDKHLMTWTRLHPDKKQIDYKYYCTYIVFGCIAILHQWIENGMKESPETMAEMAQSFIPTGKLFVPNPQSK